MDSPIETEVQTNLGGTINPLPDEVPEKIKTENREVYELMTNMSRQVKAKSIWFILSMKWVEVYQRYLYLDHLLGTPQDISAEERVHPGEISNEDII